jgi:hypothetical protein
MSAAYMHEARAEAGEVVRSYRILRDARVTQHQQ